MRMKNRLNITIDPRVLHRARQVAKRRKTSLSSMVETLLQQAAGDSPEADALVPFSRRWGGKLKIDSRDEGRFERLARKYDLK